MTENFKDCGHRNEDVTYFCFLKNGDILNLSCKKMMVSKLGYFSLSKSFCTIFTIVRAPAKPGEIFFGNHYY